MAAETKVSTASDCHSQKACKQHKRMDGMVVSQKQIQST